MPAPADVRPRDRLAALAAVAIVQVSLGLALFNGLRVETAEPREVVQRLIEIVVPRLPPPPPVAPSHKPSIKVAQRSSPAATAPEMPGASPVARPAPAATSVTPIVAVHASAPGSGGGSGSGLAAGPGAGGGAGGSGNGGGGGGTDLEKIAGDILPSDYPKSLGNAGIGGRVSVTFTVQTNGRVTNCRVTRSSGAPELDALTCRLMEQRFRFRPSTDRYGRPIPDEVDWDHDWQPR